MITTSNLGIKEFEIDLGCQMVADDALSLLGETEDVKEIGEIYAAFSRIYAVTFCYDKTILTVIGSKEDKEELIRANIKIGGVSPHYDPISVHIGLLMTENLAETEKLNVQNRIKKTYNIIHGHLKNIIWGQNRRDDTPNVEVRSKLYGSLLRPSMTSGLNVFKLGENEKKDLEDLEKTILRAILATRPAGTSKIIYKMLGQLPLRAHLDKGILSLLYNIWSNPSNPVFTFILRSLEDNHNKTTWVLEAERVLKFYEMPPLKHVLKLGCPDKTAWKNFCAKRVRSKWELTIKTDIEKMSRNLLMGERPVSLDNKIDPHLTLANTQKDLMGIKTIIQFKTDSIKTNAQQVRFGKRNSDKCTNCGEIENIYHITSCKKHKDDYGVTSALAAFENTFLNLIGEADRQLYKTSDKSKLSVQLNPLEYLVETTDKSTQGKIISAQRKFFTQISMRHEIHRTLYNTDDVEIRTNRPDPTVQAEAGCPPERPGDLNIGQGESGEHISPCVQTPGRMTGAGNVKNSAKTHTKLLPQARIWEGKNGLEEKISDLMKTEKLSLIEAEKNVAPDDSQLIMSFVNFDGLAITGSLVTKAGREEVFTDGILCQGGKENPLTKSVCISTHHEDIVTSLAFTKIKRTNTLDSLRLASGGPLVLIPQRMEEELDNSVRSCERLRLNGLSNIFPSHLDHTATSFGVLYCTKPNTKIFGIMAYEDELMIDVYLLKHGETVGETRLKINSADGDRLDWALNSREKIGQNKIISNTYTFNTERQYNLEKWGRLNGNQTITKLYPNDASPRAYSKMMKVQLPAKFNSLMSQSEIEDPTLPWLESDSGRWSTKKPFYWSPETIQHDLVRLKMCFPSIKKVKLTPTHYKEYEMIIEGDEEDGYDLAMNITGSDDEGSLVTIDEYPEETDENELRLTVEPALEREMKLTETVRVDIFNEICGDNERPENHIRKIRYRDADESDESIIQNQKKRRRSSTCFPETGMKTPTKTETRSDETDDETEENLFEEVTEEITKTISDNDTPTTSRDKFKYDNMNSKELQKVKKRVEKKFDRARDKIRKKVLKKVTRVARSERVSELKDLKKEFDAITEVENETRQKEKERLDSSKKKLRSTLYRIKQNQRKRDATSSSSSSNTSGKNNMNHSHKDDKNHTLHTTMYERMKNVIHTKTKNSPKTYLNSRKQPRRIYGTTPPRRRGMECRSPIWRLQRLWRRSHERLLSYLTSVSHRQVTTSAFNKTTYNKHVDVFNTINTNDELQNDYVIYSTDISVPKPLIGVRCGLKSKMACKVKTLTHTYTTDRENSGDQSPKRRESHMAPKPTETGGRVNNLQWPRLCMKISSGRVLFIISRPTNPSPSPPIIPTSSGSSTNPVPFMSSDSMYNGGNGCLKHLGASGNCSAAASQ